MSDDDPDKKTTTTRRAAVAKDDTIIEIKHYGLGGSVEDQAIQWLARLRGPDADVVMQAAFAEWLAADPEHQEAFDDVLLLWEDIGPALDTIAPESTTSPKPARARWFIHPASALSAAAAVLFACTIMVLQLATPVFETRKGEQSRVVLPDGSVAHLNTQTRLRVDYSAGQRRIDVLPLGCWRSTCCG